MMMRKNMGVGSFVFDYTRCEKAETVRVLSGILPEFSKLPIKHSAPFMPRVATAELRAHRRVTFFPKTANVTRGLNGALRG